eukprot:scaffold5514_cov188-Alexandrium_tamarense.AAC.5
MLLFGRALGEGWEGAASHGCVDCRLWASSTRFIVSCLCCCVARRSEKKNDERARGSTNEA